MPLVSVDEVVKNLDRDIARRQLGMQHAFVAAQPRQSHIAFDRRQVSGGEGVVKLEVAVGIVLPGALTGLAVAVAQQLIARALHKWLRRALAVLGVVKAQVHIIQGAADALDAPQGVAQQAQRALDFRRQHMRFLAQQVVNMMLVQG